MRLRGAGRDTTGVYRILPAVPEQHGRGVGAGRRCRDLPRPGPAGDGVGRVRRAAVRGQGPALVPAPAGDAEGAAGCHRAEPIFIAELIHRGREIAQAAARGRLEEIGLGRGAEIGGGDADEAHAPIAAAHVGEGRPEELARGAEELAVQIGGGLEGVAPGHGAEIVVAELESDRAGDEMLVPELSRHAGREERQGGLEASRIAQVARQRRLAAHRARQPAGPERGAAVPLDPPLERPSLGADQPLQRGLVHPLHLPHVGQSQLRPPLRRLGPDAGHRLEGKSGQKARLPAGAHLHETTGLGRVRRELRDHAVGPDPDAAIEPRLPAHLVPQALGHGQEGNRIEPLGAREVQVRLVERSHHDRRREPLEHPAHRARGGAIVRKRALEERGLRAETHRLGDRHAGVDPEAARRVRRGLHHAALVPATADDQQLDLPQLGMPLPADFDEEGVEIDVENARAHGTRKFTLLGFLPFACPPRSRKDQPLHARRLPRPRRHRGPDGRAPGTARAAHRVESHRVPRGRVRRPPRRDGGADGPRGRHGRRGHHLSQHFGRRGVPARRRRRSLGRAPARRALRGLHLRRSGDVTADRRTDGGAGSRVRRRAGERWYQWRRGGHAHDHGGDGRCDLRARAAGARGVRPADRARRTGRRGRRPQGREQRAARRQHPGRGRGVGGAGAGRRSAAQGARGDQCLERALVRERGAGARTRAHRRLAAHLSPRPPRQGRGDRGRAAGADRRRGAGRRAGGRAAARRPG